MADVWFVCDRSGRRSRRGRRRRTARRRRQVEGIGGARLRALDQLVDAVRVGIGRRGEQLLHRRGRAGHFRLDRHGWPGAVEGPPTRPQPASSDRRPRKKSTWSSCDPTSRSRVLPPAGVGAIERLLSIILRRSRLRLASSRQSGGRRQPGRSAAEPGIKGVHREAQGKARPDVDFNDPDGKPSGSRTSRASRCS